MIRGRAPGGSVGTPQDRADRLCVRRADRGIGDVAMPTVPQSLQLGDRVSVNSEFNEDQTLSVASVKRRRRLRLSQARNAASLDSDER
jgi:hypothetical protein